VRIAVAYTPAGPDASPEDVDGIEQCDFVCGVLERDGHACERVPVALDLEAARAHIAAISPDCVFNLVESAAGSDRLILLAPLLYEAMRVPYTGAPLEGLMLTTNKVVAKRILRGAGISTPDWRRRIRGTLDGSLGLHGRLGGVILKPVWEHGSAGITGASVHERVTPSTLTSLLLEGSGDMFAERFVGGREFNLSLLAGPDDVDVLPPAEIVFEGEWGDTPRIVGYDAKWTDESFEARGTPRRFEFPPSDRALLHALCETAIDCWRLFGLRGYARVDFRVDGCGRPWVLEVNANPCLSPDAGFMAAARRARLTPGGVLSRIVNDATHVGHAEADVTSSPNG
jgi:D-alanine-D-alanine ligase